MVPLPPNLPKRWLVIVARRDLALEALATDGERASYIKRHPAWNFLKKWLAGLSANKCWYCEAKSPRAHLDVDHYRPKLAVTVHRGELIGHLGYRWLTYDWQNFRLSCQTCNRPAKDVEGQLRGKGNEFPLRDEAARCHCAVDSISNERPTLLDPREEADCALLIHAIDGEVKPLAHPMTWEYQRARYTIECLGFNLPPVPEHKRRQWQRLMLLIECVGDEPLVIEAILDCISPEHEYSSFFRSAVSTHRDKFWVEAIL